MAQPRKTKSVRAAGRFSGLWFSVLVLLGTLGLAVQSFRSTFAWSADANNAMLKVAATDGMLRDRVARRIFAAGVESESVSLPKDVPGEALTLAKEAFSLEPFAYDALVLVGVDAARHGDLPRARRLIGGVASLTKRDVLASIWLIEDLAAQGEIDPVLVQYDRLLRVNVTLRPVLMGPLLVALEDPTFIAPFKKLLEQNPQWSPDFWTMLASAPKALANGAELRTQLRGKMRFDAQRDDPLFEAMARAKLFEETQRLHAAIVPAQPAPAGELVKNADFARAPMGGPIDWLVFSDINFGSSIDPSASQISIYSIDRGTGTVARQLLSLAPGTYQISTKLNAEEGASASPASISISCQDGVGTSNLNWPLANGANRRTFQVAPGCRFFYLDIVISASSANGSTNATLDGVSIRRQQ